MTDEVNQVEELHDEVTDEIVEETLDEANAPAAKGKAGKDAEGKVTEPESIASVDKAADATGTAPAPGGVANQGDKKAPKTKAGMVSAMTERLLKMSKADLGTTYGKLFAESAEMEEDEVVAEASEVDTTAELDALVESEATLSDEFKAKTAVLFETAVKSKVSEEITRLEEQYKEELEVEVSATKEDLVEKVDNYLNYVVETWMEENQIAVQNGLRTEIAEKFMGSLKDLFVESYIEVPESKVDLVDELAEQVEELEGKLNETTQKVIEQVAVLEDYKRDAIIRDASRNLADTQVEKLKSLVADVDFNSEEQFAEKVAIVVESHFAKPISSDEEQLDEEVDNTVEVSSSMDSYLKAIRKIAPKS